VNAVEGSVAYALWQMAEIHDRTHAETWCGHANDDDGE
jgi:hypothetical protein